MKISFANDHAATAMRKQLIDHILSMGHEVIDHGTESTESVDYPDQAEKAVHDVLEGKADRAIVACGTGIGISIAANKFPGIRCAICTDLYAAQMARAHNNANCLALRGREIDPALNNQIIDKFLTTDFESGRHQMRLDKIAAIEKRNKH